MPAPEPNIGTMTQNLGCGPRRCAFFAEYANADREESWNDCTRGDWLLGFLMQLPLLDPALIVAAAKACIQTRPVTTQTTAMIAKLDALTSPTTTDAKAALFSAARLTVVTKDRPAILQDYANALRGAITWAQIDAQLEEVGGVLQPKTA